MAGRKIRDEREARPWLEAADESGKDRARWARANGIDGRSPHAWRLNHERSPRQSGLRLVEFVAGETADAVLRVECGPFVVEVPSGVHEVALGRLLVVVAAC